MSRIKKNDSETAVLDPPLQSVSDLPQTLEDGHPNPAAMDLWEFMRRLNEEQWDHYIGYLYRTAPKKMATDKAKYLMVFTNPVTIEEIQQKYGGKKFTIHFNRKVGTRQQSVYPPVQFDIEAEPIWHDGEAPLEPGAKQAAGAAEAGTTQLMGLFEKLLGDVLKQRDQATQDGKGFNVGDAFKEALATQKDSAAQAIAFVREQQAGKDNGMVDLVTKMMEKFMEKKESPLESKLLDKLLDRAFGDGEKEDPFEKMTSMLDFADRIRGENPKGGGRSSGTNWVDIAGKLIDQLPGMLQNAKELIQTAAQARGIQAPGAPGGARPALIAGPTLHPPGVAGATAPPNGAPPPGAAPGAPAGPMTEQQAESIVVARIKQVIVEKLFESTTQAEAEENGMVAAELADAMHPGFAEHLAEVLKTDYSQLAGDPVLSRAAGHPNVIQFCKQYIAYFDDPGAGGSEESVGKTAGIGPSGSTKPN